MTHGLATQTPANILRWCALNHATHSAQLRFSCERARGGGIATCDVGYCHVPCEESPQSRRGTWRTGGGASWPHPGVPSS
eukprot:419801-Rhodomonas_salina.3